MQSLGHVCGRNGHINRCVHIRPDAPDSHSNSSTMRTREGHTEWYRNINFFWCVHFDHQFHSLQFGPCFWESARLSWLEFTPDCFCFLFRVTWTIWTRTEDKSILSLLLILIPVEKTSIYYALNVGPSRFLNQQDFLGPPALQKCCIFPSRPVVTRSYTTVQRFTAGKIFLK